MTYNHFISVGQRDTWCTAITAFGLDPDQVAMSEAAMIPRITIHENGTATLEADLMTRREDGTIAVDAAAHELVLARCRVTAPVTAAIAKAVGVET